MTRGARAPGSPALVLTRANIWEKPTPGKPCEPRIPHAPGERMKRPSGPTIAAFVCAALVGLLYVSPVLKDVARTGLDWPIWIDHPEGLIHTNYGKWWVLPPHHYLVDGSSGEFPIYYPSLSDSLINVVAEALGLSRHDRAGGPLRPAAGLCVPAPELPVDRGRRRRPPRGARRPAC